MRTKIQKSNNTNMRKQQYCLNHLKSTKNNKELRCQMSDTNTAKNNKQFFLSSQQLQQQGSDCSSSMMKMISLTILMFAKAITYKIDLNQLNQYSNSSIIQTVCNKDMEVDFSFSSRTILTCSNSVCELTGASYSTMFFLNPKREYLRLTLTDAEITSQELVQGYDVSNLVYYVFYFSDQYGNKVDVILSIGLNHAGNSERILNIWNINNITFKSNMFDSLLTVKDPAGGIDLSVFNFMNYRDYGKFAQTANNALTRTALVNQWIINLPFTYPGSNIKPLSQLPPSNHAAGNKICYASYSANTGLFQTHLRENWPLWVCFFLIIVFWSYYLISPAQNKEVFNEEFRNNKWTCWALYSLHYLSHDQFYFSRLCRSSLLLFTFSLEAVILAAMYTTLGTRLKLYSDYSIIFWYSVVAAACAILVPFILGGVFLKRVYRIVYDIFKLKQQRKILSESPSANINGLQISRSTYQLQYKLSIIYYWYYIVIFFGFICFWAAAIHMTLWMTFQFYYLQRLWFASLMIAFAIQNFILDPILTCILGNTKFYQARGFYYNYQMGDLFKKVQFDI